MSGFSGKPGCFRVRYEERKVFLVVDQRVPVLVANVILREDGTPSTVGSEDSQLAPLEVISSLVTRLLRTAQGGRPADVKTPPEEGMRSPPVVPAVGVAVRGHSAREWARVCFSCRRPGHGVNCCSQVDTSFPSCRRDGRWMYGMANIGWYGLVELEGGLLGKRGMVRAGGSASRSLGTQVRLTLAGEMVDQGEANWHGSCQWGVGLDTAGHRARTLFRHWGAILLKFVGRITDSCRSGPRRCWEAGN